MMSDNEFFLLSGFIAFGVISIFQWLLQLLLRDLRETQ